MKQAIICAICEKPKKASESYSVMIRDYRQAIYSEYSRMLLENHLTWSESDLYRKVKVCRTCIKKMGYKVKKGITKLPLDNHKTKEL